MGLMTLLLAGLILLAFINILTVIGMLNRLEARTDERMVRLERKVNRMMAHMQVQDELEEDANS